MKEQLKIYRKTLRDLLREPKVPLDKIERFKSQIQKIEEQLYAK